MKDLDHIKLIRYGIIAIIISLIFFFVFLREPSFVNILDSITLAGICFLILALFRTAKYLRFYDLPIYGSKKFVELFRGRFSKEESKVGEYHDFVQKQNYQVNFLEAYVTAGILLVASMLISML